MILAGSCKEGFGNDVFAEWMLKYQDPDAMIKAIRQKFQLGGHKAAAIAMIRKKAEIFLVSDMDSETVSQTILKPYQSLQQAYEDAQKKYGQQGTVIVMPYGGSTLPKEETE